jgi:hypothetical protein
MFFAQLQRAIAAEDIFKGAATDSDNGRPFFFGYWH